MLAIKALLEVVQSGSKNMEVAVIEKGKTLEVKQLRVQLVAVLLVHTSMYAVIHRREKYKCKHTCTHTQDHTHAHSPSHTHTSLHTFTHTPTVLRLRSN